MSNKNVVSAGIFLVLAASSLAQESKLENIEQHWAATDRHEFWYIDQGSKIMPMAWFLKLECATSQKHCDSTGLFSSSANLKSYGFITDTSGIAGALNPHNLPIGFSSGSPDGVEYAGLTCAACHTANIKSGNRSWIIEGGPAMLNFDLFLGELVTAVDETRNNIGGRLQRFKDQIPNLNMDEFNRTVQSLDSRRRINTPVYPAGFARVDAFGHIFNQIIVEHLKNPEKFAPKPNAPASYPELWDIAQHPFVQWNYSAPNLGVGEQAIGSLARNIGEVLGVFGTVDICHNDPKSCPEKSMWFYKSSANIENLRKIEALLANLRSPLWPFDINQAAADRGKWIYMQECSRCHALIDRNNPPQSYPAIPVEVAEVGTEPLLAKNINDLKIPTGILKGAPKAAFLRPAWWDIFHFFSFGSSEYARNMAAHLTLNLIPSKSDQIDLAIKGLLYQEVVQRTLHYKSRPLNGIWASAPYLHNGSVPSLVDLLKPDKDRPKSFCVGDGEYDPISVGYKQYQEPCPSRTEKLDTAKPGNSSAGHQYGVWRTQAEKSDLLEFLKRL
jgi:hypothetical protein